MDSSPNDAQLVWPEIAVAADIIVLAKRQASETEVYSEDVKIPEAEAALPAGHPEDFDILLVKRKYPPFEGSFALPGGGVEINEDLEAAARRELLEEAGIALDPAPGVLSQFRAYGAPGRDPRCRVVSVVFWTLIDRSAAIAKAGDDASEVRWFPLDALPPLAFDHGKIIKDCLEQLFSTLQQS